MYTYEERIKAVKEYIDSGLRANLTVQKLGYPTHQALRDWYKEYKANGDLHRDFIRESKYTEEQKQKGVKHYMENGMNLTKTFNYLGYVKRDVLRKWVAEALPKEDADCIISRSMVKCTQDQKREAVIELLARGGSLEQIANKYGVVHSTLNVWKNQMLAGKCAVEMPKEFDGSSLSYEELLKENEKMKKKCSELHTAITELQEQKAALKEDVYHLQLEKDVLEKAGEILKKEEGINLKMLSNKEKAILIDALRDKYSVKELLASLHIAKSSYCYCEQAMQKPDKYADLRTKIKDIFFDVNQCYGYRRIHTMLKKSGLVVSEKVIRHLMREENLIVPNRKKRHYSSYLGEISPAVENAVKRDFFAQKPNCKWLTDITEFHIPSGKVYLSPIIDCYDGMVVSWTIGTSPNAHMVNSMLDEAVRQLHPEEHPIVHSDRGAHYRWPGWIERMHKYGLTRSMSKKGCSPDNSACEGFFGRLKNEMFYGRDWSNVSVSQFIQIVDSYVHWYNEDRIKLSLGGLSPMQYRRSQGLC